MLEAEREHLPYEALYTELLLDIGIGQREAVALLRRDLDSLHQLAGLRVTRLHAADDAELATRGVDAAREHHDDDEAERGHATSIVRYDPGARFSSHEHPGGEEILVLDGIFSDETGDFSAGTYFRNPLGFRHTPFSSDGCLILVKLHQFQPDDDKRIAIKTGEGQWHDVQHGVRYQLLHEHMTLLHLPASAPGIAHPHPGGERPPAGAGKAAACAAWASA